MPFTFRAVATLSALLLAISACGKDTPPEATGESACTHVDVPMLDVETRYDGEPRVRLPMPEGWVRYNEMGNEVVRAAIVNKNLTDHGFTPNAVYTLDKLPGNIDAQKALDQERAGLEKMGGAKDLQVTKDTVCGLPGQIIHYTGTVPKSVPPHPGVMREAVLSSGDNTYVVTLVIQTTKPDNPTFQKDSKIILDGLQVLPPEQKADKK